MVHLSSEVSPSPAHTLNQRTRAFALPTASYQTKLHALPSLALKNGSILYRCIHSSVYVSLLFRHSFIRAFIFKKCAVSIFGIMVDSHCLKFWEFSCEPDRPMISGSATQAPPSTSPHNVMNSRSPACSPGKMDTF